MTAARPGTCNRLLWPGPPGWQIAFKLLLPSPPALAQLSPWARRPGIKREECEESPRPPIPAQHLSPCLYLLSHSRWSQASSCLFTWAEGSPGAQLRGRSVPDIWVKTHMSNVHPPEAELLRTREISVRLEVSLIFPQSVNPSHNQSGTTLESWE